MLKSLADNSDQELDVETDTDSDFDDLELAPQIQQPVSPLTSPISSPSSSSLGHKSLTVSHLPESAQTQLDRQNRKIAKATAKF